MNYQTQRTRLNAEADAYGDLMVRAFSEATDALQDFQQAHQLSDADMAPLQRAVTDLFCRSTFAAGQAGVITAEVSALDFDETAQAVTEVMPS